MAKGANQKIKILYLMQILLHETDEEHGLTLAQISEMLSARGIDAERKTLYDDIEILRVFGLDIEKRKEKNTVKYCVVSRDFELPELKLLVDAVQSSKFITHKKSNELIKKIEGFASKYDSQQLQRQVFVANRIKAMNESIYYTVDYIHEAINKDVKVSFKYFNWNEKKEKVLRHDGNSFVISPWALTWDDENYYLIGFDSFDGIIKHYRVDKMLGISLTDEKRDGAQLFKNFDMALYAKYGYKSDDATINKIALEIGRTYKTTKQMITGGVRNMMFTEFYRQYADEDGEEGAEDVTIDTTTEPSRMFYHERRLKILCEAFENLEYRERAIVAEHLGFCENCWSPYFIEIINSRKVKREFEETAFIDLAGKHGVVPSSADRIYRGAIDKLRKALEKDKWL